MKEESAQKIWNVWENENKIISPVNASRTFEIIHQIASIFSGGSYYYYILNFDTYKMSYVHASITEILGLHPSQFSLDTLFEIMHPDDLDKMYQKELRATNFLLKFIPTEDIPHYKVSYLMRLRHKNGTYKTILHQAKAIAVSKDGKVQQVLGLHTDVSHLKKVIDHKVSFLSETRPCYYSLENEDSYHIIEDQLTTIFTPREQEIIKYISEGKTFKGIALALNLSPKTINTHKRNILKKVNCKNTAELIVQCIRDGLI